MVLDELHGPRLGRAGDRDGPHVGEEGVEGVELGAQPALDVVDGVDEAGVELDLAAADDLDRAGDADARLVVAVDVGAHGQLRLLLHAGQQRADGLGVLDGVAAAGDGAGDRAGLDPVAADPDVHLGRGADQVLALTEADDELVRGGVAGAQAAVEAGGVGAGGVEDLAGHDLEQVAALELLLGGGHDLGVFALRRVGRHLGGRDGRGGVAGALQAAGARAVDGELVAVLDAGLALPVDHDEAVGQVQHEVALVVGADELLPDGLELEGQVVAEGAVEAEVRVVALEGGDDLADGGEDGGPAAAHLLRQQVLGLGHVDLDAVGRGLGDRLARGQQAGGDGGQHDPAALVERGGRDRPALGHQLQARVDVAEGPSAVAARVVHARGEGTPAPF